MSFLQVFGLFLTLCTLTLIFKDNMSLRSHRVEEIMVYLNFFFLLMEGFGSVQIITDPDPDPRGQKHTDPDLERGSPGCVYQQLIQYLHVGLGYGFAGGGGDTRDRVTYYKVFS
jgi:hypothetical protein